VREEPALGQLEILGEPPNRQPFEPDTPSQIDRVINDGRARRVAFSH
jgi:hypothetical protein